MTKLNQTPTQVSVIIPCYNEVATIRPLLDALRDQTYPRQAMEVVISDGGSTDGTQDAIKRWQSTHPDLQVTVIVKPSHGIPAALNIALKAASGTIIVRLDAHSKPNPEYVARSVEALESGKAENVGGVWDIQPGDKGWIAPQYRVCSRTSHWCRRCPLPLHRPGRLCGYRSFWRVLP